jgi:transposase
MEAAEKIVESCGAKRWTRVEVKEEQVPQFRQQKRGRPGKTTLYRRRQRLRFDVTWVPNEAVIDYDARCDGIFPLITNDRKLSQAEVLKAYKYQPRLEKRHAQLKSSFHVAPVLLKNEGRVEALLFLYFLVQLVQALIEREVRRGMKERGLKNLPLYPEGRDCSAPCTERILEVFEGLQRHHLQRGGTPVQVFEPKLNKLQKQILGLLHISTTAFTRARN